MKYVAIGFALVFVPGVTATIHTGRFITCTALTFRVNLGRLITRCLIAHPDGADTIELAHWAYGEVLPRYARHNVQARTHSEDNDTRVLLAS
jgi:hypothetical protein